VLHVRHVALLLLKLLLLSRLLLLLLLLLLDLEAATPMLLQPSCCLQDHLSMALLPPWQHTTTRSSSQSPNPWHKPTTRHHRHINLLAHTQHRHPLLHTTRTCELQQLARLHAQLLYAQLLLLLLLLLLWIEGATKCTQTSPRGRPHRQAQQAHVA
jgi:hypothetical protein